MPFAKAPIGDLRLRIGEGLDETWEGTRDAKAYYPHCVGYGVSTLFLILPRCGVDGWMSMIGELEFDADFAWV